MRLTGLQVQILKTSTSSIFFKKIQKQNSIVLYILNSQEIQNTTDLAFTLKNTWSLFVEVAVRKVAACQLFWPGTSRFAWNQKESWNIAVGGCGSWHVWWTQELIEVSEACVSDVLPNSWVKFSSASPRQNYTKASVKLVVGSKCPLICQSCLNKFQL